jgi:hypothetical protein
VGIVRFILSFFVLAVLAVLAARNLALRGVRLDEAATRGLERFNFIGVGLMLAAMILLLVLVLIKRYRKKVKRSRWPLEPPR